MTRRTPRRRLTTTASRRISFVTDTPATTTPSPTQPLPTEPYLLAELLADAPGPEFDRLYAQLHTQLGNEQEADRIWDAALEEVAHDHAHDHAHDALREGISVAAREVAGALDHLDQLMRGDGYCAELADRDGEDLADLLMDAGRMLRAAEKYVLVAAAAEERPSPSSPMCPECTAEEAGTPFTPENVRQGEDGRWYHDGVEVTDRVVGWKCSECGERYQEAIGTRIARGGTGCPLCQPVVPV